MEEISDTPKTCPACNGSFVTETLYGWVCADCGATKERPESRKAPSKNS